MNLGYVIKLIYTVQIYTQHGQDHVYLIIVGYLIVRFHLYNLDLG